MARQFPGKRERKSKKYEAFLLLLARLDCECMSTFQKLWQFSAKL